ncbi:MAG: ATP-binding protein [Candidatus Eisenbacteria bacterium]
MRDLEAMVPAGPAGRGARRALERLMEQAEADRLAALPEALARFEQALAETGRDPAEVHEHVRALARERHAALLHEPAVAHVIEAPHRRADMLSWLLRENANRTERMSAESQRLQQELTRALAEREVLARELERQRNLAEVGLLAAGLAHDINNILQVVGGHTAMVRHALAPDHPDRPALDAVIAATHRAGELARRMIAVARQESAPAQAVDLDAVVTEIVELVKPAAPKHVRIEMALAGSLPPVFADPTDARRVALNLVVNAWQAIGPEGGTVRITTGPGTPRRPMPWLEVSDDGCGMSEEVQCRVFQPFFTTRADGRGLGLPTVHALVEKHGGTLEIHSESGKGTRVRVSLPEAAR